MEGEPLQPLEVPIRFSLSESVHLIYKQNRIWKLLPISSQHTTAHLTLLITVCSPQGVAGKNIP